MRAWLCLALFAIFLGEFDLSNALSIDIAPGYQQCVGLEVVVGSPLKSTFKVHDLTSATERAQIALAITKPDGGIEYSASNTPEGNYLFEAALDGRYRMCLRNTGSKVRRVSFEFSKGSAPLSENDVARKKDLEPVEAELYQLEAETDEIFKEMHVQRDRDDEFRELNDGISDKVMMYSVLSIVIMLSAALWQVFSLKSFLHHIKIL